MATGNASNVIKQAQWKRIEAAFTHHPPKDEHQVERYRIIRETLREAAELLCKLCPDSRELNKALGHLEDAQHYGIAAIGRNE